MMNKLNEAVSRFAVQFKETYQAPVKIAVKNNTDGILSGAVLIKAFQRENLNFSAAIFGSLNDQKLQELSYDSSRTVVFVGFGQEKIGKIREYIKNQLVFIIDNFKTENKNFNVNLLNPSLENEDIPLPGITYLFAKKLNSKNSNLAGFGFAGSILSSSEFDNFLLKEALDSKKITVARGLLMFYGRTMKFSRILENSFDPFVPGVTGERSDKFLKEIKLENKIFIDYTEEELKKIYSSMIVKMLGQESKKEIFGNIYLMKGEKDDSIIKDMEGMVKVIEVNCAMKKGGTALGMCLGDDNFKIEAAGNFEIFREEIIKCYKWFFENRKSSKKIIEKELFVLIKFDMDFKDDVIKYFTDLIKKNNIYSEKTVVCSVWQDMEGESNFYIVSSGDKFFEKLISDLEGFVFNNGIYFSFPNDKEEEFVKKLLLKAESIMVEEVVS